MNVNNAKTDIPIQTHSMICFKISKDNGAYMTIVSFTVNDDMSANRKK